MIDTGIKTVVKLIEYYDDHFYRIETDETIDYYPSVTTQLSALNKPGLARVRGDLGNREMDLRMFIGQWKGKRIHYAWYRTCNGWAVVHRYDGEINDMTVVMEYQDEYIDYLKIPQFIEIVKPQVLCSERIVYSHEFREAGTVDNVMYIKAGKYMICGSKVIELPEGYYVVDLKTGKAVYDSDYMQIASYANMLREMGLCDVIGGLILHTGAQMKTGIIGFAARYRTKEELEQDFRDYRAVSQMWARQNKNSMPRTFEFPNIIKLDLEQYKYVDAFVSDEQKLLMTS